MSFAESLRALSLWVALGVAFTTGTIGGLLTKLGPWYRALEKPAFQPPDWLFGPAWTTNTLMAGGNEWTLVNCHASEGTMGPCGEFSGR